MESGRWTTEFPTYITLSAAADAPPTVRRFDAGPPLLSRKTGSAASPSSSCGAYGPVSGLSRDSRACPVNRRNAPPNCRAGATSGRRARAKETKPGEGAPHEHSGHARDGSPPQLALAEAGRARGPAAGRRARCAAARRE